MPRLSPTFETETRLLLAATHPAPSASVLHALCEAGPDWSALLREAVRNRLAPLMFHTLDRCATLAALPDAARSVLERHYAQVVHDVNVQLAAADIMLGRLTAAELPVLVLRGPAVGIGVYANPYLRTSGDIDLLCRRAHAREICRVLEAVGYAYADGAGNRSDYHERFHLHRAMVDRERNIHVEIHWALDHPLAPTTPDLDRLQARAETLTWRGLSLRAPAPIDQFAALTLHLTKHVVFFAEAPSAAAALAALRRERHLRGFVDIVHLAHRYVGDAAVGSAWRRQAADWGLAREAAAVTRLAATLYPDAMPDINDGAPLPHAPRLKTLGARLYFRGVTWKRGATWHPETGFRWVRVLDAFAILFPTRDTLRRRYRRNSAFGAGLYIQHSFAAARHLAAMAIAIAHIRLRARRQF